MSRGFTLFDIAFALLLLTIVGMIAIPGALDRIRIEDEARAVSAVQWVAAAQAWLRTAPAGVAVDRDGDGETEYGFLPDLLRAAPRDGAWGEPPFEGDPGEDLLRVPGFYVAILLPGPEGEPVLPSRATTVEPDFAEKVFAVIAWPVEAGKTGYRAYFANQELLVWEHPNEERKISGRPLPIRKLPYRVLATRTDRSIVPPPGPGAPWLLFLKREQKEVLEKRLGRSVGR
jgi:hypothetical protein